MKRFETTANTHTGLIPALLAPLLITHALQHLYLTLTLTLHVATDC
jgi:hypothetical protein